MSNALWLDRPLYLERMRPFFQTDLIKIILGQRRVGKSALLHLIKAEYALSHPELPLLHIEMERSQWKIDSGAALEDLVHERLGKVSQGNVRPLLLIDEVQEIKDFAPALRSLAAESSYDIFITGSNARLLAGEIATLFAGRSVNFTIHGLSYAEFLRFHEREDTDGSLELFLRFGGMPYLRNLGLDESAAGEYLDSLVDTILLRDIVERFKPRNIPFLRRLLEYAADTLGNILSAKGIADYLKSQRLQSTPQIVLDYLEHLQAAFLLYRIPRWDIRGKRLFEIGEKYFFEDLGIRNRLRPYSQSVLGQLMENAVCVRLLQLGYTARIGKIGEKEVDFVASKGESIAYIQVSLSVAEGSTREREFGNLLSIEDNHPKYLVSMDPLRASQDGVRHLSLREFLLLDTL